MSPATESTIPPSTVTVPYAFEARAVRVERGVERTIARRFFRCRFGDPKHVGRRALRAALGHDRFLLQIRPATARELGMQRLPDHVCGSEVAA